MIIDTNACNYNHLIYTFKLFSTFSQQQEYLFIIMIQTLKMKEFRFLIPYINVLTEYIITLESFLPHCI